MTSANPACDAGIARASRGGARTARPRLVLLTTILASSMAFVDGSVVNVGLAAIGRDLEGGAADLQWVVNAYLLPLSALLLAGGALGDRFGRRRLLIIGVAVFAAASAACALAPSLLILQLARAAQGVGAALLLPNSLAILGGAFEGEARGRAVGAWASFGAMSGAVAPLLGGWLIDGMGWPAIFLLNLPLAAATIILALTALPKNSAQAEAAPLDLAGAALATGALGLLTWGLTIGSGPSGWTPLALATTGAGAALGAAFLWVEKRRGDQAMTPLALFGSRDFVGLSLLTLLLYGVLGGLFVLLPFVLIEAGGYSATAAGAALAPFALVMTLASPAMGALAGRLGARPPLICGSALVAGGLLLALRITADAEYWTEVLPVVGLVALGMSAVAAPLTTAVLGSVDEQHTGSASGLNSALARIGGLVATALLGAVLVSKGDDLVAQFHIAATAGAAVAFAAAACALVLYRPAPPAGD